MSETTWRPGIIQSAETWHPGNNTLKVRASAATKEERMTICGYIVHSVLRHGDLQNVYLVHEPDDDTSYVLKESLHGPVDKSAFLKTSVLSDQRLLKVIRFEEKDQRFYQLSAYLENGSLDKQSISETVIRNVVLPQLCHAVEVLHNNGILHNDIKPSNILWVVPNKSIVLSDFDTVCEIENEADTGGTPEYMAPEVLSSGGIEASPASDICSIGLTILSLLNGVSYFQGAKRRQIIRGWQRGIIIPSNTSTEMKILLKQMMEPLPNNRINFVDIHKWLKAYGTEDQKLVSFTVNPKQNETTFHPLLMNGESIYSIKEMIDAAGENWSAMRFLFTQKKISLFLRQFNVDYYDLCVQCEKCFNKDEGLFKLLHGIKRSSGFCWMGSYYDDLENFVILISETEDTSIRQDGKLFLQAGLLVTYFTNIDCDQERIEFAKRITETAKQDPDLAIMQLAESMYESPTYKWKGIEFYELQALIKWLFRPESKLDDEISELYHSKRFESWISFIHEADLIKQIKKELRGIDL